MVHLHYHGFVPRKQIQAACHHGEGGPKDTDIVLKVQKKCLRVIKGVNNRVTCKRMYGEFKILTVTSL
jgi:hypothetical protein